MQGSRRSRIVRQIVLPLLLVAFLPACHQWVQLGTPPNQRVSRNGPSGAQVILIRSNGISPTPNRSAIVGVGLGAVNDVREASTRIEYFDIATIGSPKTDEPSTGEILLWTSVVAGAGFVVLAATIEEDLSCVVARDGSHKRRLQCDTSDVWD